MAIKKSDLYSSLWASCDELRGGMDASQYKDYVLFMLFIKYVSDKYAGSDDFAPPVTIPKGASFKDMVALKGTSDIGDMINKQVIQPLIDANSRLARSDFPNFNDPNKLGDGAVMVEKLSNLIAIFEKPELDFSNNRAEHDDILGDAYEYLMRHFATESGKSKGQFYTPAEVSRIMAKVIGISPHNSRASTTAYDPTCGSGSLLLKVAAEAGKRITLEGQEKDVTTAGLARMNMILHDFPTANILSGNTLDAPKFKDGEQLRTYDYVVANPPFSDKTWSTGLVLRHAMKLGWHATASIGIIGPAKEGWTMPKKYIVRLTDEERETLRAVVAKLNGTSQKVRRAQILLKADADGPAWTDAKIAEAFDCRTKTVENIRERLVREGFETTLNGKPRLKPRPKLLDGEQEAKIIALRLGPPPAGFSNWTLRLLAEQVVALEVVEAISHETVRRTLKKTE